MINSPSGAWVVTVPEAKNYRGNAWYKLPLDIRSDVSGKSIGIHLPLSYGGYEIFVNEASIYKSSNSFGTEPRVVEIPVDKLKMGSNYITLKVSSFSGWGGFAGFLEIGTLDNVQNSFSYDG